MTAKPTTKPRLSYRGQALAAVDLHKILLEIDDTKPGLVGWAAAPAGHTFVATGQHTMNVDYDGKREAAWPKLAKTMKAGVQPCTCTDCEALAAPAGPVLATDVVADLLDKVLGVMTSRQVAGYRRTARPFGPFAAPSARADYHKGWAAGGSMKEETDVIGWSAAFAAGFNDRRSGAAPWTSFPA